MKKAVIIGASSGIGRELALILSKNEYIVGITGRRIELLEELKKELGSNILTTSMDVTMHEKAIDSLKKLIKEMGGMDLIIINAGIGFINPALDLEPELVTINTNVSGFAAIANVSFNYFKEQGYGHIVGISSISALMSNASAPAYNASKSFMSNYLNGLRKMSERNHNKIYITDVQPGYVDTEMAKGRNLFWVASPKKAAEQIYKAIIKKRKHIYITKRWRIIAWILKIIPDRFI